MAGDHTRATVESIQDSMHDMDAHESTYRGFPLLMKFAAAAAVVTPLALYFFLAR